MSDDENPYLLGPFFDVDPERSEIIPVGFEESHEPLSMCMGGYKTRSNEASVDGIEFAVTNKDVTAFIQADWDRVFGPVPPARGFLLGYRAGAFAAGRVAEEIILHKLLPGTTLLGSNVQQLLLFDDAQARGLVAPRRGSQSDDLILCLGNGSALIAESKAAFSGRSYLRRCIPKAVLQLAATLRANQELSGALLCLINLKELSIQIVSFQRDSLLPDSDQATQTATAFFSAPWS